MGDHEYDYAVEAAEEAYYDHVLSELRRDHGEEIADEITTQEVIEAVIRSHKEWWPLASAALAKAKTRLTESEYEEVVFHAARAFDGYIRNVLVLPLKAALAERFQRFMPPSFPFRKNAFFRAANGVGDNAAFADYSLSVVAMTADEAARSIESIHRLLASQDGLWRQRDRALHAPIEVKQNTARSLLADIDVTMTHINTLMEARIAEQQREVETREFTPGRIELMYFFKLQHDRDPSKSFQSYEVQVFSAKARHQSYDSLRSLVGDGYIEILRSEGAEHFGVERYRLSSRGDKYYRERVVSRLPESLRRMRLWNSADLRRDADVDAR